MADEEPPISLSNIRSLRNDNPKQATSRDVLLRCLQRIDNGEWKPDVLFVAGGTPATSEDGNRELHCEVSSPDMLATIGLAAWVARHYMGSDI